MPMEQLLERHTLKFMIKNLSGDSELALMIRHNIDNNRLNSLYNTHINLLNNIYLDNRDYCSPCNVLIYKNVPGLSVKDNYLHGFRT